MLIHLSICLTLSKQKVQDSFHLAVQDLIPRAMFCCILRGADSPASKDESRGWTSVHQKLNFRMLMHFVDSEDFSLNSFSLMQ